MNGHINPVIELHRDVVKHFWAEFGMGNFLEAEGSAKVKIFGWRVLCGLIPVKVVIANRHICSISSV